jgi:ferredoxin
MVKYRVSINKNLCVNCGTETGRCPTHARVLAKILADERVKTTGDTIEAVFPEDLYPSVKAVAECCPVKAIVIEQIK